MIKIFEGTADEVPPEYIMYKLCEKFGWTESDILNSSYHFIKGVLKIMNVEYSYMKWKKQKNGSNR